MFRILPLPFLLCFMASCERTATFHPPTSFAARYTRVCQLHRHLIASSTPFTLPSRTSVSRYLLPLSTRGAFIPNFSRFATTKTKVPGRQTRCRVCTPWDRHLGTAHWRSRSTARETCTGTRPAEMEFCELVVLHLKPGGQPGPFQLRRRQLFQGRR